MSSTKSFAETLAAAIGGMVVAAAFLGLYVAVSAPVLRVLNAF